MALAASASRFFGEADFADKLQRGVADFFGSDRRVEVEKVFDIAAHESVLSESLQEKSVTGGKTNVDSGTAE